MHKIQILSNKALNKYMYGCVFDIASAKENHERNSKGEKWHWQHHHPFE